MMPGLINTPPPDYGKREDGSPKGHGFFGSLGGPDKKVSTEISIGVNIGGKETQIPSLVPTLNRREIDHLLSGGAPTKEIINKAADFAIQRMKRGLPAFALPEEEGKFSLPPE